MGLPLNKEFINDDKDGEFISTKADGFVLVIINYCATYRVIVETEFTDDPAPVFLTWCNNTSTVNWANHTCMKLETGRALGKFFCRLLMNSLLGINAWLMKGELNENADEISRQKISSQVDGYS